ncbi:MAG: DUF1839 family protein [Clostridia bacterium]|nr:DUF1839 family protein [Deltaproteobacteria bacterium]
MAISLTALDPTSYLSHLCHTSADRAWIETNCYVDVWIELVHACKLDVSAMMGMTLGVDFEGDQWTFFKPSHEALRALYGIQVEELTVWQDVVRNAAVQVARGRVVLTEADSFFLPDTAATDYQRNHVKTTIGIVRIAAASCDYFHNGGFWRVSGEDFAGLFAPVVMPWYCEFAKLDNAETRPLQRLRDVALGLLRETLRYRPSVNPFIAFNRHLVDDGVTKNGLAEWHKYAFVSLRQCGAAFELAAMHLQWLARDLAPLAAHTLAISASCKSLILKGARAASAGRGLDAGEAAASMAEHWETLMTELDARLA